MSEAQRVTAPVVTITSQELRDNRNYRIYQVRFDGELVSETLSQPGNVDIQWLCEKGRNPRPVPAEFRGVVTIPKGRKNVQPTPYQMPQAQARGTLEQEYAIYVESARALGWVVKTYEEWLQS